VGDNTTQHEISRNVEGRMHLSSTKTEEAKHLAYKPSQQALSYTASWLLLIGVSALKQFTCRQRKKA